jgi:hypothetical protein
MSSSKHAVGRIKLMDGLIGRFGIRSYKERHGEISPLANEG